jgi:acetyltransferase-like isoleucine patch superfamily enzyme
VLSKNVPPFSIVKGAGMSIVGKRVPAEKQG